MERIRQVWYWQILLQKSPLRNCRIKIRNNRIGATGFLNQRCALAPDLESILRARMHKIVLQHNRHRTDLSTTQTNVRYWEQTGKHLLAVSFSQFDPKRSLAGSTSRDAPSFCRAVI